MQFRHNADLLVGHFMHCWPQHSHAIQARTPFLVCRKLLLTSGCNSIMNMHWQIFPLNLAPSGFLLATVALATGPTAHCEPFQSVIIVFGLFCWTCLPRSLGISVKYLPTEWCGLTLPCLVLTGSQPPVSSRLPLWR